MPDKIVNHFVLADGSTAKYDAGALLNLDETVSLAGYAPDAKAVGDRLSAFDSVLDDKLFSLTNSVAQVYSYNFLTSKTYYVTNKTPNTTAGIRTSDASGDIVEWIKNGLTYGETVEFKPTIEADYFRIYCAQMNCEIEIVTNGVVIESVYEEINKTNSDLTDTNARIDNLTKLIPNTEKFKNWRLYQKPDGFSCDIPLHIFTDGYSYITDYNKENYKNESTNTYYLAPNGLNTNDGSKERPWKTLYWAITHVSSGDTIVLLEGDYDRSTNDLTTNSIQKSLNVIGDGNVRIFNGDFLTFTAVSGYTSVYKATRSLGVGAFEVDDDVTLLSLVESIADVETTVGSYFKDGNDYYVHPIKNGIPNAGGAKIFVSVDYVELLSFDNSQQNVRAYLENLTIIGSTKSCRFDKQSDANTFDVCLDNVNFMWCGGGTRNAVETYGGTVVLNECKIFGSYRDGINYCGTDTHGVTYRDNLFIEINCEASNCGIGRTETNMNGSTGHRNSHIVRINCTYHDNHGPNCCDVQSDTKSINLCCVAYNSTAEPALANHNFDCQTENAEMWLENCIGVGANADFYSPSDGTMHIEKCSYDTKSGAGVVDTNPVPPMVWMIRNYKSAEQLLRQ